SDRRSSATRHAAVGRDAAPARYTGREATSSGDRSMDAAGVARAATGMAQATGGAARRSFSLADVGILDELVQSWSHADQIAVARQMLAHPAVESSPIVRGPLATLKRSLHGA